MRRGKIKKVSVIVPVYNESSTVLKVLKKLREIKLGVGKEVIVVDDGSTDGTAKKISRFKKNSGRGFKYIFKEVNEGKGAAIQKALELASGEYVVIQDADLEYDPEEIKKLIEEARRGERVVYGTRNKDIKNRYLYPHYYWGAKVLYLCLNLAFGQKLTDPETGHKLIQRKVLSFPITEKGFGVEIELTAKLAALGIKIVETSIGYNPRSFEEGKKIRTKDGLRAFYLIGKYWLLNQVMEQDRLKR